MRLLNTTTCKLEEFGGKTIPPYAILSHTWGKDEITFEDMKGAGARKKAGSKKVQNTCARAAADGFDYVWIDTCCIDKTSSAELSEAINSMYRWYQESTMCYAYLADVPSNAVNRRARVINSEFSKSRWFTRGWTLQELIAPWMIIFLDKEWQEMGTKSSLQSEISAITGIPANILSGGDLESASIAQRMSWASARETTRVEDLAYCLMGIFGINMPLLYGEGGEAFTRLQEEIMRVSDDHSLFAWHSFRHSGGLLAPSPAAFSGSGNIIPVNPSNVSEAITVNNKGIHLKLRVTDGTGDRNQLAILRCEKERKQVQIHLTSISETEGYFERTQNDRLKFFGPKDVGESIYRERSICVRQNRPRPKNQSPLLEAAGHGKDRMVKLLLEKGAPPECKDEYDRTPLWRAAENGHEAVVRLLMARADVKADLKNNEGQTLLSKAAENGHETVVELLITRADVEADLKDIKGQTPLSKAAEKGHEAVVELLIGQADVEADSKDSEGQTPLSKAAANGHETVVELLMTRADVEADSKDRWGYTPLWRAAVNGHEMVIRLLIMQADVEADSRDNSGRTPLLWAAAHGHETVARLLMARADVETDSKDKEGQTPLSWAAQNGHETVVRLLIEADVETDSRDYSGWTPFSWAAAHGHETVVRLLMARADVETDSRGRSGQTPLSRAAMNGYETVVRLLMARADVETDSKDEEGQTPLSWAARNGHETVVRLLMARADVKTDSKDKRDRTPLSWAVRNGHETVVRLLTTSRRSRKRRGIRRRYREPRRMGRRR